MLFLKINIVQNSKYGLKEFQTYSQKLKFKKERNLNRNKNMQRKSVCIVGNPQSIFTLITMFPMLRFSGAYFGAFGYQGNPTKKGKFL